MLKRVTPFHNAHIMRTYPQIIYGSNDRDSQRRNPWLAGMLSIVPGLGQMYNGHEIKGLLLLNAAVLNILVIVMGVLFERSLQRPDFGSATLSQWLELLGQLAVLNVSTMFITVFMVASTFYGTVDAIVTAAKCPKPNDSVDEGRFRDAIRCSYLVHMTVAASLLLFVRCHSQQPVQEAISLRQAADNLVAMQKRLDNR